MDFFVKKFLKIFFSIFYTLEKLQEKNLITEISLKRSNEVLLYFDIAWNRWVSMNWSFLWTRDSSSISLRDNSWSGTLNLPSIKPMTYLSIRYSRTCSWMLSWELDLSRAKYITWSKIMLLCRINFRCIEYSINNKKILWIILID